MFMVPTYEFEVSLKRYHLNRRASHTPRLDNVLGHAARDFANNPSQRPFSGALRLERS